MNSNTVSALYKFADTLQVPLRVENQELHGERRAIFPLSIGVALPLDLKVVGSFLGTHMGVALYVSGDLYLLLTVTDKMFPSLWVVDASLIGGEDGVAKAMDVGKTGAMTDVYAILEPGVISVFVWKDRVWNSVRTTKKPPEKGKA